MGDARTPDAHTLRPAPYTPPPKKTRLTRLPWLHLPASSLYSHQEVAFLRSCCYCSPAFSLAVAVSLRRCSALSFLSGKAACLCLGATDNSRFLGAILPVFHSFPRVLKCHQLVLFPVFLYTYVRPYLASSFSQLCPNTGLSNNPTR